jgi:hypothetical protein
MPHHPRKPLAELKLLATPDMIPTAKRTAASLGSLVGFSLEDLDELNIAVAQACDRAIETGRENWGGEATLKLSFWATERGLEVDVQALPARTSTPVPHTHARQAAAARSAALDRLAEDMIRCFVDDFRGTVEPNRVRYRMVKYLIG